MLKMEDDFDSQENEILALESIFEGDKDTLTIDDSVQGAMTCKSGRFSISPAIENEYIRVTFACSETERGKASSRVHEIQFLPPITLNFSLPKNYPSCQPPQITLICKWLSKKQLAVLREKLYGIWEEQVGQEVLYSWSQYLKENTLHILGITDEITIRRRDFIEQVTEEDLNYHDTSFSDMETAFLEHNEIEIKRSFDSSSFSCNVCCSEKYGIDCLKFKECQHVYCRECITSYFDIQIKDGNVKALTCPELKCTSQAYPAQVKELVGQDKFQRYESLLLQTTLDMMGDVMYCPRKYCQAPVVVEEDIGICSVCKCSFCPYCKLAYHGIAPCRLKAAKLKEICSEYKTADAKTKKEMEAKYGARELLSNLANIESEEWISRNSKNCPGCGAAIEKNDGCNKMVCYKCKNHFCWLCMHTLSSANPYDHFNTFGSKCFNKLFQGATMDDFDVWL